MFTYKKSKYYDGQRDGTIITLCTSRALDTYHTIAKPTSPDYILFLHFSGT
jgi:hypothetical protein